MENASTLRLLHEPTVSEPYLVLDKPAGLPCAPLRDGDDSALTRALALFPALRTVAGRKGVEHGLVHRIDTLTRGCVLIAATQEAFDVLVTAQKGGFFTKWYEAEVSDLPDAARILGGFPPLPPGAEESGAVTSAFRPYGAKGREVRPVTGESGRAAARKGGKTTYTTSFSIDRADGCALCRIQAGYRHQVRCHLAWLGFPVRGDPLYNPSSRAGETLSFTASRLSFPDPADSSRTVDIRL